MMLVVSCILGSNSMLVNFEIKMLTENMIIINKMDFLNYFDINKNI